MLFNLTNPIPEALKDPLKLQTVFKKYGIIPYYGDDEATSHATLQLLTDLARLSPSHSTCKSDLSVFAFGEQVNIARKRIPGLLDTEQEAPLPYNEKLVFSDWLYSLGINLLDVIEITRRLFEDRRDTGNAYLHIKIVRVGSTVQVYLIPISPLQIAYLRTDKFEDPTFVVTEYWDEEWWRLKPPSLIKASFPGSKYNWGGSKGVQETIVHFKNDKASTVFYGRPKILSLLNWMFAEYQLGNQVAKVASTEFVAKYIGLFEETDPTRWKGDETKAAEDFRQRMMSLRKIATNEGGYGEAKSLVGMEYPYGQKAPIFEKIEVNRDTQYMDKVLDLATTLVFASHGWSKELSAYASVKASIGSNILIDLFTTKNISTIQPIQSHYENIWADVFQSLAEAVGYNQETYTVQFPDLISKLVKSLVESRSTKAVATDQVPNEQTPAPDVAIKDTPPAE